ncbi:MAG: hypothetical protein AB2L09_02370 [Coriobacteriia bacterium]
MTAQKASAKNVILVLAPYLQWSDVSAKTTPALWDLMQKGAVGNINVRSRLFESGTTLGSPLESALALSSGSWATPDYKALPALEASETIYGMLASEAYYRYSGASLEDHAIGYFGLAATQRANTKASVDVTLGAVGGAIVDAGGVTAAVGNSDCGYRTQANEYERPAAVAAMDTSGRVRFGEVSSRLLALDPRAPFGVRTDLDAFSEAFRSAQASIASQSGPSLLVLDPGDGFRARRAEASTSKQVAEQQHADALTTLDSVVALAAGSASDDTVVIVASQALSSNVDGSLDGFGPVVVYGSGWNGYLTSSSTHRTGLVTNLDLSATVLDVLGIEAPVEVLGNPMASAPTSASIEARTDWLSALNTKAVSIDEAKPGLFRVYVGLVVAVLLWSIVILGRPKWLSARATAFWVRALKAGVLLCLATPVSAWLMFLVLGYPSSTGQTVLAFAGVVAVLWAASIAVDRVWGSRVAFIGLSLLTAAVLLVDQWAGAPLSFTSLFGYSPLLAARFYGIGNEAASMAVGSSMVGFALLLDQGRDRRWVRPLRRVGSALLGIAVVVTCAAPFFGANVGVAIWGLVGFAILWLLTNGFRLTWKLAGLIVLAVVVLLAALAAIDLLGGGELTHLGRSLLSAEQGGIGELVTIVIRKAQTNARIFGVTNWSWVLLGVLVLLAGLRVRPNTGFRETLAENPMFAHAMTATLVAGFVGFFTEDSGIVIPALIMFYTGMAIIWLMLMHTGLGRGADSE